MLGDKKEEYLKPLLREQKILDRKRPFKSEALTLSEFSKKYWMDGEVPYQYHSVQIQDGATEAEQLVFNNIRALKNDAVMQRKTMWEKFGEKQEQINDCKKELVHSRRVQSFVICTIVSAVISVLIKCILRCLQSIQCQR